MDPVLRLVPRPAGDAAAETTEDQRLVAGLRNREAWAAAALVDRHGPHVRRVLVRVLGADDGEHRDLLQEVFTRAFAGIGRLAEAGALKAWLTHIAVFTAREAIRRRRRRRWLWFVDELPEREAVCADPELREAAQAVYRVLDRLPVDERIPLALRLLEGMELEATAAACGMSVATVRRRLARAEDRFYRLAREHEALAPWIAARDARSEAKS